MIPLHTLVWFVASALVTGGLFRLLLATTMHDPKTRGRRR